MLMGIKEKIVLGIDEEGDEILVDGFYLEGNTTWDNDKPYVIYGYVGVNHGNRLTIEKGARIHFHENSGLLVEKNGYAENQWNFRRKSNYRR